MRINKFWLYALVGFSAFGSIPKIAQAAVLNFNPADATYRPGQEIAVQAMLNTEKESLNAVEANITYPNELLQFIDASDANSVLNLWPQRPENKSGQISFAGIVTGGYKGDQGLLVTLIFKALKEGKGNIAFIGNTSVLKNDGNGTAANLSTNNLAFTIKELGDNYQYTGADYRPSYLSDTNPPENFFPQIARNENIFEGKWFVAFNTQDKESGVDHYEAQENVKNKPDAAKWQTAASPYLLNDQKLESYIFIKAVDKAGNSMLEIVAPRYEKKGIGLLWYIEFGIILFIVLLLYIRRKMNGK